MATLTVNVNAQEILAEGAFVDGDKTKLDNQSGTNTGDQVIPTSGVDFDPVGTDNSTDVTLDGTGTYITIAGQVITVDPITESDIADLGAYILNITGSPLSELQDVTITTIASGEILKWNGSAWINQTLAEAGIEPAKGTDDNFVTDAEKVVIGNTSGTNTGDQSDAEIVTAYENEAEFIIGFAFTAEDGDIAIAKPALTFTMPNFATTLVGVSVSLISAPTGSVATFDLNEAGVSVLSTLITIDATEFTSETAATPPVISDSSLAANAVMQLDVDGVGSTLPGTGGKCWIYYKKA